MALAVLAVWIAIYPRCGSQEEAEEVAKPVSKNKKYRRDKPWDSEDIDHWKARPPHRSLRIRTLSHSRSDVLPVLAVAEEVSPVCAG